MGGSKTKKLAAEKKRSKLFVISGLHGIGFPQQRKDLFYKKQASSELLLIYDAVSDHKDCSGRRDEQRPGCKQICYHAQHKYQDKRQNGLQRMFHALVEMLSDDAPEYEHGRDERAKESAAPNIPYFSTNMRHRTILPPTDRAIPIAS